MKSDSTSFDIGHGENRDQILYLALREAVDFLKQDLDLKSRIGNGKNTTP